MNKPFKWIIKHLNLDILGKTFHCTFCHFCQALVWDTVCFQVSSMNANQWATSGVWSEQNISLKSSSVSVLFSCYFLPDGNLFCQTSTPQSEISKKANEMEFIHFTWCHTEIKHPDSIVCLSNNATKINSPI